MQIDILSCQRCARRGRHPSTQSMAFQHLSPSQSILSTPPTCMVVPSAGAAESPHRKEAQFYVEFSNSSVANLVAELMDRLIKIGYSVSAIAASGLARPRLVVENEIYSGLEAIRVFIEQVERAFGLRVPIRT
jgi:hypothetical protein